MANEEPRVFQPGDTFNRYYTVEAFIGAGTFGQVYVVKHRFTGDRFAVKVSHLKDRANVRQMARNLVEAKATYSIRHHNVVQVLDLACEDDGMVWQIMELLEGSNVEEALVRARRFSPIYAIDIAVEVACGLLAAHELQIIHRDVKPSNVFVTRTGLVKLMDFSIAKVKSSGFQTTSGKRAVGTSAFMAPEQIAKAPPTPLFDIYALGMLLWQMLVGRHPFADCLAVEYRLVVKQVTEYPGSLTAIGLPAYCDEVIRRATAKDPRERYQSMWEFARALGDLRARLLADPAAEGLVHQVPEWEEEWPIARDPARRDQYSAPFSLPSGELSPRVPSARIVVSPQAAPASAVVQVPAPVPVPSHDVSPQMDLPAPTVRALPPGRPRSPRWTWALFGAAPVVGALCTTAWLLLFADAAEPVTTGEPPRPTAQPVAPAPSTSIARAPRAPAPSATADTRRPPAPRPKR